jgi:hypothetical protein
VEDEVGDKLCLQGIGEFTRVVIGCIFASVGDNGEQDSKCR